MVRSFWRLPEGAEPSPSVIECHAFPSDDREFAAFVGECRDRLTVLEPHRLCGLVRERYPATVVHVQTALAHMDGIWIWYVYRDGAP